MFYSEAEKAFYEDVREKKKTASGVHGKTGKKGYVGKMLFPTDIMSRKDKYNHRKAGKVVTTNLYEKILTIDEFDELEDFEKRNRLQYWRNEYTTIEIKKGLGIGAARYYEIIEKLGLPKAPRGRQKARTAKVKAIAIERGIEAAEATEAPKAVEAAPIKPIQEIMVNGIHLIYNGTFSPAHIQNQLLKFASILDGENDEFYIELKLVQKGKK